MSIPENMKVLSTPYWIPKIHKSPIDTRFIIANKQCAIKRLSKNFISAFKLLYKSVEKYYDKNSFWVIQNRKPVIDTYNNLSNQKAAQHMIFQHYIPAYRMIN